jgi:hypothetical protein
MSDAAIGHDWEIYVRIYDQMDVYTYKVGISSVRVKQRQPCTLADLDWRAFP